MPECLVFSPTSHPQRFKSASGEIVAPPTGWVRLPPGDAGLTRRVKAAGTTWQVVEKKGRKTFSHGLWAPGETITKARAILEFERTSPAYTKRREADAMRREKKQEQYVGDFSFAVLEFLAFAPPYAVVAAKIAELVVAHATPVGSGTVARTEMIPIENRAEAAVIAWMRHQTTAYDYMTIARVKGKRREVRRQLAEVSRRVLDRHRNDAVHAVDDCVLCRAILKNTKTPD